MSEQDKEKISYQVVPLQGGTVGYKFRPVDSSGWDVANRFELEDLLELSEGEIIKLGTQFKPEENPIVKGKKFFPNEWSPPYGE